MKFDALKKLFPETDWDVGYLSLEQLKICAHHPLKEIYHEAAKPSLLLTNQTAYDHSIFINALVLVRKTAITLDYSLNQEAEDILAAHGLQYQVDFMEIYTNFKLAAILAGLGVRAKNSLVHSFKFGFDCKICCYGFAQNLTDTPAVTPALGYLPACDNCNDCRSHCPVNAIHNAAEPYWLDSTSCNDFIAMSYHDTIPSIKKFWHKYVHPEMPLPVVQSLKECKQLPWDANGYAISPDPKNRGKNAYKNGQPVYIPVCRECQTQPRCSHWNGNYPYKL